MRILRPGLAATATNSALISTSISTSASRASASSSAAAGAPRHGEVELKQNALCRAGQRSPPRAAALSYCACPSQNQLGLQLLLQA